MDTYNVMYQVFSTIDAERTIHDEVDLVAQVFLNHDVQKMQLLLVHNKGVYEVILYEERFPSVGVLAIAQVHKFEAMKTLANIYIQEINAGSRDNQH